MNTFLPVGIVLVLGGISGFVFRSFRWPLLTTSLVAALAATATWVIGTYIFMAITGWGELGWPLFKPIASTFFTAWLSALLVGWMTRAKRPETHPSQE